MTSRDRPKKPGPEPERLKIKGDWKEVLRKAVRGRALEGELEPDDRQTKEESCEEDEDEPA
jgi:hypothetical protein